VTGTTTPLSPKKARRQKGIAMIELALTLPLLLTVLSGIVQFGGLFFVHNKMINVARDVTRRLAVGEVTQSQAQTMVQQGLSAWTQTFTVIVTMPTSTNKDVAIEIQVPKASVSLMDIFGMFKTGNLTAKVVMRQEEDLS
jgi:Flp pilus assembly protein TadG